MTIKDKIFSYFNQAHELKVLFVFDSMAYLQTDIEADPTPWPEDYVFQKFQGDWFGTKVRLAEDWKDKKVVLLFDPQWSMPQRNNQESCQNFPLMSILEANMVFSEEDAIAFMQQRGIPETYADFFQRHISELRRDKFLKVLSPYYNKEDFHWDCGYRGLISVYLDSSKMLDWPQIIARLIILSAGEKQKALGFFGRLNGQVGKTNLFDVKQAIDRKLISLIGFTYNDNTEERFRQVVEAMKYNAITQWLSVENNDPYKHLKVQDSLKIQNLNSLLAAIKENPRLNTLFQNVFESLGNHIKESTLIDVYGADAKFAYMSERMCRPLIRNVIDQYLYPNPSAAIERLHALETYLDEESSLHGLIDFLILAARYYETTREMVTLKLNTPGLYVNAYASRWYMADMLYRQAVTVYVGIADENRTASAEDIKLRLDQDYAALANDMNMEWVRCLKEFNIGFASLTDIERQSDFYVNHLNNPTHKVAVIISDAFRYEMGVELLQILAKKKHQAEMTPMLAMLPTETKYCKLAMLPHQKLECTGTDLLVDGNLLDTVAKRTAHVRTYFPKSACIDYRELMEMPKEERRAYFTESKTGNKMVYIFHNTIDNGLHGCTATEMAKVTTEAMKELADLVPFLHDAANVENVYITSDHGFLYNDLKFEEKDKVSVEVPYIERKTRYFISEEDGNQFGVATFPINTVSAMTGKYYLGVPVGTNRFAAPSGDYQFAHGGASLQELIVPVIFSKYQEKNAKRKVNVSLLEPQPTIYSSRLKVHLVQGEAVSMNIQERIVNCAVYVDDKPISAVKQLVLNSNEEMGLARIFEVVLTVNSSATSQLMQFKVYDNDDNLNPLIVKNIVNTTLIDQDF